MQIEEAPGCHASATTLSRDATRTVEVGDGIEAEWVTPARQATKVGFPLVAARSRNDLHHDARNNPERTLTPFEFCDARASIYVR